MIYTISFIIGILFAYSAAELCSNPDVTTLTYTSRNTALSTETAYVAEFNVACKEEVSSLNLYAEIEPGVITPVAAAQDGSSTYQVSWAKPHKTATTGNFAIKVFGEEGYTAYRKAQRNGEDSSKIEALFSVTIHHPGAKREGLFVQTEFVAVVVALLIWWTANSMRSQIME